MIRSAKYILCLLSFLLLANTGQAQDTTEVVTDWIKQHSIPIKYIEAGNDYSDLLPLKKILQNVQVVGLGESTHGTKEFFTMKHRIMEFLVTQMGFTAFALEASYSDCQPINDYILTGKGDRAEVLTGQGIMAWDTEEFSAMLDWMRAYNQNVPDEKKIRFYGIEAISTHRTGRERVMEYINKYVPEKLSSTDSLFRVLASEDEKWPSRIDQNVLQSAFIPLETLMSYFTKNKDRLVNSSSLKEWEQIYKYLEVLEQGLYVNVVDIPSAFSSKKLGRDEYSARNLFYIMEKRPDTKIMIWLGNGHIARNPGWPSVGYNLHQKLGDRYYSIGFECYEGTFQARVLLSDGYWGELKADTLLPVQKSLGWYFNLTGKKNVFIDLRNTPSNQVVEKWLNTPIRMNAGSWMYRGAHENFETGKIKNLYDGILFIEQSTPVQPTKNALIRSENRIGF